MSKRKITLRSIGLDVRGKAFEKDRMSSDKTSSKAEIKLKKNLIRLFELMDIPNGSVVSSYMAVRSEIKTSEIMNWLGAMGYTVCLPAVEKENRPLKFYEWKQDTELVTGRYGILVPNSSNKIEPDVLLCPLVSFDLQGNRLGYGGGYYDRTIQKLRTEKDIIIVGLGFLEQKSQITLPHDQNDQKLDAMVTNERYFIFNEN